MPAALFISAEEYDPLPSLVPFPVEPLPRRPRQRGRLLAARLRTWRRMLWTAGFDRVEQRGKFKARARAGWSVKHVVHQAWKA